MGGVFNTFIGLINWGLHYNLTCEEIINFHIHPTDTCIKLSFVFNFWTGQWANVKLKYCKFVPWRAIGPNELFFRASHQLLQYRYRRLWNKNKSMSLQFVTNDGVWHYFRRCRLFIVRLILAKTYNQRASDNSKSRGCGALWAAESRPLFPPSCRNGDFS